ncbi:MAG: NAD-dependent epimerase/dehydratase family protein [Candidatus Peribacteraceae bacterium]|nr:NAD-dependent epimerase/dehydratase family protein [Candidatus Peribacteraceae bacterium]
METVLITGGAGFFGDILKSSLLERGYKVVSIDLEKDEAQHPNLVTIQGDIRNAKLLDALFTEHSFVAVFHLAAILAHAVKDKNFLWSCNVDGTREVASAMKRHNVRKVVYTSTNCLWGAPMGRPVKEEDTPHPIEIYGKSKLEGEDILLACAPDIVPVIIRCPTIMDAGRLGLLAILFEFIDEGRIVWVVGGGDNRYQFIYAHDLVDACVRSLSLTEPVVLNIGSDNVKSFREVYDHVIRKAGTKSRVGTLPKGLTLFAMRVAYKLGLSPLGPYQYKMIAEDFEFDTTRIRRVLDWKPTLTNEQMLYEAYEHYHTHRKDIENRTNVSAHKQGAKMGIIRLLKWFS